MRRRTVRRPRSALVAGVVVALGATVAGGVALGTGAVRLGSGGASNGSSNRAALPPATAAVARQDLVDRQSEDGTLGYGDTTTVVNREQGTVTWIPAEGQILRRGATLYRVDTHPVTLMYGSIPFYRALANGVTSGADVKQLEENLRALGYTGFTVDKQFTSATAAAIKRWQDDQGLTQTGSVDVGQVLFLPGPVRVQADKLTVGNVAGPGAPILDVTGKGRIVTVKLAVSDQRLAKKGASVTVDLPSGDTVDGKITKVGTVAHAGSGDNASDSTIDVTVNLAATTSTGAIDQAPVTVNFTSQERKNVLSVPVAALLALSEGGYGVQVVDGSATRIVAVQTGLFADGQVEITGTGITAGTKVGVPAT